ncbi:MAG: alkaline phosphatase family protein, partial [Phycisphaerae bacterium]|nr:alkaline phosphatase family protein [Phycisphaerae bacterium]
MLRVLWVVVLSLLPGIPSLAADPPAQRRIRHVIIISIDGLRPDVLLRADTPNLRALLRRGSFS